MDIYSTNTLIEVVRMARVPGSFLRTRYMPTSPRDIFKTKKVYIERSDDGNKCAPFVIPYSGAKLMLREGYTGDELQPAFLNPARDMTIDQLMKKSIGETLYDETSPEEREQGYLADDLVYLQKACQRTQEWMCGQIITQGHVDCAIGDASGTERVRFQYYDETFDNKMTFSDLWAREDPADGAGIYDQVSAMANDIDAEYGDLDLILGANLVSVFLTNENMLKMLDVANANFGAINPGEQQFPGVGFIGAVNFGGKLLNVYSYNAKANINGEQVSYIDPDYAVVIPRSNFGATKFGAITQMEQEDNRYHTYYGEMVPRYIASAKQHERQLEMASAPLPHPYAWDSWRVCKAH